METKFNFKSAICTSREQSERLLALGLKKETADMWRGFLVGGETLVPTEEVDLYNFYVEPTPAWSLHRLLCLYGADYEIKEVYNNAEECYGMLICAIEIAIENGDFNEEYLER